MLATQPAHADGIAIPNGSFDQPKKSKHGALIKLEGLRIEGKSARVTRFTGVAPHEQAIALGRTTQIHADVVVPKPIKPDKLAPDQWYCVASVDVLGLKKAGSCELTLAVHARGKRSKLASESVAVTWSAQRGGKTVEDTSVRRLWVKLPSSKCTPDAELTVTLTAAGSGNVVIDRLRLDRFHDEPGRPLVGKPNGHNGPDLLASGALGFTALTEHARTAFSILLVREDGPSAKAGLRRSDLVVAVDGTPLPAGSLAAGTAWFVQGHEAVLGRAVQAALSRTGSPVVRLTVLRDGGTKELKVKVPIKRQLEADFPFGASAQALYDDALGWVVRSQQKNGAWPGNDIVNSSLAGLALLGSRDRSHKKRIRELAKFMLKKNPTAKEVGGFSFWAIAFQGIFLCEYHLATGDKRALAWIEDAITWLPSTTHKSKWGMPAFGHSPKGLPYNDKALMAPCAHLLVFEALALRCGVKSKIWKHIEPYVMHSWSDPKDKQGHGGMGYNGSYKDKAEFWSRTGLTALALMLRGDNKRMRDALAAFMVDRHQWMLNSHAYGEPGGALGLVALSVVDPKGFATVCAAWRWRFLNAWEPGFGLRYSSPHMGSPYMGEEAIVNPAYAMLFAVRTKGLVLAGGEAKRWLK